MTTGPMRAEGRLSIALPHMKKPPVSRGLFLIPDQIVAYAIEVVAISTFTPGPMVELMAMRLT